MAAEPGALFSAAFSCFEEHLGILRCYDFRLVQEPPMLELLLELLGFLETAWKLQVCPPGRPLSPAPELQRGHARGIARGGGRGLHG